MGAMLVEGSDGTIRLDGAGRIFRRAFGSREESEHHYNWENRGYGGDAVFALQAHVLRHLRDGAPLENTGQEYLRNLYIEEAVYRANAEGRWIPLAA
jgi:D-apiose dehydrogenase